MLCFRSEFGVGKVFLRGKGLRFRPFLERKAEVVSGFFLCFCEGLKIENGRGWVLVSG